MNYERAAVVPLVTQAGTPSYLIGSYAYLTFDRIV